MSVRPAIGDPAPPFRLQSHDGGTYALQDFSGRPLVFVFVRHLA